MKQVLIPLGILLAVMLGFYWISTRNVVKNDEKTVVSDNQIYFESDDKLVAGEEKEIRLMAKYSKGEILSYRVDFNFDSTMVNILNVEVNKEIFSKVAQSEIDAVMGKVMVIGEGSQGQSNENGEVLLAVIKMKGLKKGSSMFYASRKAESEVLEEGNRIKGNLTMPNFKMSIL